MAVNTEVLAIILGGGQGSRLFPLTQHRSKPAVPIGGKYRLIDIPISNCLHADIRRIFVLTQFNSASLNRHISQTYRMDLFSPGFVEILAAEQTPDNPNWYQGNGGRRSTGGASLLAIRRRLLPDSRGRSPVPDGLHRSRRRSLRPPSRHHDRRTAGVGSRRFRHGYFSLRSQRTDRRIRREAQCRAIESDRPEHSDGLDFRFDHAPTSLTSRRWASMCSLVTCWWRRSSATPRPISAGKSFPPSLGRTRVNAHLHRGYWADVGTIQSFYDANIMLTQPGAPFSFYDRTATDLHAPAIPARRAIQ